MLADIAMSTVRSLSGLSVGVALAELDGAVELELEPEPELEGLAESDWSAVGATAERPDSARAAMRAKMTGKFFGFFIAGLAYVRSSLITYELITNWCINRRNEALLQGHFQGSGSPVKRWTVCQFLDAAIQKA